MPTCRIPGVRGSKNCINDQGRVLPGCWVGAQSLPREITVTTNHSLTFAPARELASLVGSPANSTHTLAPGEVALLGFTEPQLRVTLDATAACKGSPNCSFGIDLLRRGGQANTNHFSSKAVDSKDPEPLMWIRVYVEVTSIGTTVNSCGNMRFGQPCPQTQLASAGLEWSGRWRGDIWVDRSIVETFSNDGSDVLVSLTGYGTDESDGTAALSAQAWSLGANVTFNVSIAPVRSGNATSDPGPWVPNSS